MITYHISTNNITDTFVGVKRENGTITVCFPFGYNLPKNDAEHPTCTKKLVYMLQRNLRMPNTAVPLSDRFNVHLSEFPINDFATIIRMADMKMRFYQNGSINNNPPCAPNGKVDYRLTYLTKLPDYFNGSLVYRTPARVATNTNTRIDSRVTEAFNYAVAKGRQLFNGLYGDGELAPNSPPETMNLYQRAVDEYLTKCEPSCREYISALVRVIEYLANDATSLYYFGTMNFNELWGRLLAAQLASVKPEAGYKSFEMTFKGKPYLAYPYYSTYSKTSFASHLPPGEALDYLKFIAKQKSVTPAIILPTTDNITLTPSHTIDNIRVFYCGTNKVVV